MNELKVRSNKELRVLSIVQGMWGGVGKYAYMISKIHSSNDLQLRTIVINCPKWPCNHELVGDVPIEEIIIRSRLDFSWIKLCVDHIRIFRPHFLFVHGFNGPAIAMMIRWKLRQSIPFICSHHGDYHPPTAYKKLLAPFYNFICYFIFRHFAFKILTVSNFTKMNLAIRKKIPTSKIKVVHNCIAADFRPAFSPKDTREVLGIPETAILIGTACRLDPEKGVGVLLEAFSQLKKGNGNLFLIVAGDGQQYELLKQKAAQLCLFKHVYFLGFIKDIDSFLNAVDIYVLPSLHENHSIALLEAMRAGKAIVATDVGGNGESIRHGKEGFLVPANDVDALSKSIKQLVVDEKLRCMLGLAARKRFEKKFFVEYMLVETSKFLRKCSKEI